MPAPRPASDRHIVLRLPRHTLKIAGIAFAAGLLLFLLVWATGRKDDFYKASPAQPTAGAQTDDTIAPLPAIFSVWRGRRRTIWRSDAG
ncbi:hypothetical protein P2C51_06745, partial [Xanthomonas perforans]